MTNVLKENKVLILVGPTAVGKTDVSIHIARKLGGDIVSADSRQVYKYMDIGTAKPTHEQLDSVQHHFINVREPDQFYSAGEYGREARNCVYGLLRNGIVPVVVGGSGFYIQALVDGLFAPGVSDLTVKEKWHKKVETDGVESVFAALEKVDPVSAKRLHPNDIQRVVRALEVYDLTGEPISKYQKGQEDAADFQPVFVGLTRERSELYSRIEYRVDEMFKDGLLEEVESLKKQGFDGSLNALKTVGYKEVFAYLNNELVFTEMVDTIKKNTRRYAKRQLTWFRKDSRIQWLDIDRLSETQIVETVLEIFKKPS